MSASKNSTFGLFLPFETDDLAVAVGEVLLVKLFSVSFPTDDFSGDIFAETVNSQTAAERSF